VGNELLIRTLIEGPVRLVSLWLASAVVYFPEPAFQSQPLCPSKISKNKTLPSRLKP
jgi:hypothetical protein